MKPLRNLGSLAGLLLSMPTIALAADPHQCIRQVIAGDWSMMITPPYDLGGGLVQELNGFSTGYAIERATNSAHVALNIVECSTGRQVGALTHVSRDGADVSLPAEADLVVKNYHKINKDAGLDEYTNQFEASGLQVAWNIVAQETCGCAVFYPELRGDKAPWSGQW